MFLTVYRVPPEIVVQAWLARNLPLSGLPDRGINPPVILGHPLFVEGVNGEGFDKNFPKVGVEWVRDKRTENTGETFLEFRPSANWKQSIQAMKDTPKHERAASDDAIDALTRASHVQSFTHMVESTVVISGFASGGAGRNTMRSIYETIDSMLSAMVHDISQVFNVSVLYDGDHEVNITSEQFASPVWGFEIPIRIAQMRRIFRPKVVTDITAFDISLVGSRTQFGAVKGIFDFDVI